MRIGGATRVFALLGDPVAHSLSPAIQNAAFAALGLDAVYVPLRTTDASLGPVMASLAAQGGGGNVTVPHKETAARVLGSELPAVNTFRGSGGAVEAIETDSVGITAALERLAPPDGPWCLVGTGGSAQAAVRAAAVAGVRVAVRSRSAERARAFLASAQLAGVGAASMEECLVVINCTPLGLGPDDPLPLPPASLPRGTVALDLVYRAGETPWVRAMRNAGARAADGREVLLAQGAAAFEFWFPGIQAPIEVMRAALRAQLG